MKLGVLGFFLTVAFVPYLAAGSMVPRLALLAIAVPVFLFWADITLGIMAVAAYALLSLLWTPSAYYFTYDFCFLALWLAAFCIGRQVVTLEPVIVGMALGLTVNSAAVLGERLGWWALPGVSTYPGLFLNHNFGAEAAGMVAIGLIVLRRWWLLLGLLPTLLVGGRAPSLLSPWPVPSCLRANTPMSCWPQGPWL